MATPTEIQELRNAIDQQENAEPWTDEFLGGMIDAYGVDPAAGKVWLSKATQYHDLMDISEGGSSRKMSQLFDNAMKLANRYSGAGDDGTVDPASTPSTTRKAERG